jgi:DNA-binding Lrp family transcriptional regulator
VILCIRLTLAVHQAAASRRVATQCQEAAAEAETIRKKLIGSKQIIHMKQEYSDYLDVKVRDAQSAWNKLDEVDVKILQGLSVLGPRNLKMIANDLKMPSTTVRYRVKRMLEDSILFFHLNPYHTNMGLKKAVVFVEASQGYEDTLLDCLRVNDFWLLLCRVYGPFEGCGGIWTIPKDNASDFESFLQSLKNLGVAESVETNWSTCFEGIPVYNRWFDVEKGFWVFNWDEWIREVETIEGELPYTLVEPDDWPIQVDYEDVLIIKELEKDGRMTLSDMSKKLDMPLEKLKYHFREHVSKRGLIEGYQIEIYRFPSLISEYLFFKFEFDSHEKMEKFALSLLDKPFPIFMGKVLGNDSLIVHVYLPRQEFRKFISSLSKLIKKGLLKRYHYIFEDMFQVWRQTIPYEYFRNDKWDYDWEKHLAELNKIVDGKKNHQ